MLARPYKVEAVSHPLEILNLRRAIYTLRPFAQMALPSRKSYATQTFTLYDCLPNVDNWMLSALAMTLVYLLRKDTARDGRRYQLKYFLVNPLTLPQGQCCTIEKRKS